MDADRARDKAIKELQRTRPKWRQGEVTSTSPLEVSIGGGTPVSAKLVAGVALTVGDQVQVLQRGSDLLVLGVPSGTVSAGYQPLDSDLTAIAALTTTSFGRALLELANAGAGRSALGLVIGTDVQAYDSDLAAIAALSTTSFGRSLLTQADAAAARSTISAAASSHTHAQSDITSLVSDLAAKAPLASPALTGNPTAPTQTAGNNSTRIATTAYVDSADAAKAPLASPTFTGDPKAPTPATSDNDTSVATTAYVKSNLASYAPLASPTFTGNPTAPTPSPGDADTSIATTGFVDLEVGLAAAGFSVKPQADFATVQALDLYTGTGTGTLEASVNGTLQAALGLAAERWGYSLTFLAIGTPYAIARDSSGNFYVTYNILGQYRVGKFDSSGNTVASFSGSAFFGANGSGNGQFGGNCYGITVDSSGNIYVADTFNNRIQKFNSSGVYQSQVGSIGTGNGQFFYTGNLACDSSNNVWASDIANNRVQKFNSSLVYQSQFGSYGTGNGQFNAPYGLAIDSSNNVWVADTLNHRVQKFNSSGTYQSQFGSFGTGDGNLSSPFAIAIDSSTNLFVVDSGNNRIQKFNSSGTYQAKFGSKGTGNSQFGSPFSIAVDSSSNLYVCDVGNKKVQKWDYITTAITSGQSVLVKDQAFGGGHVDHGVYRIDAVGGVSAKWRLIRRDDMDTSAEVPSGLLVNVRQRGPIIPGGMWYVSNPDPITVGTTALIWEQFLPGGYPTSHADSHGPGGNDELPDPILGFHELTSSFTTTGTHTNFQDEGLTASVTYAANRRIRCTLKVNPNPSGGAPNIIRYQLLRGSTVVSMWQHKAESTGVTSHCYTAFFSTSSAATETFKVQILATPTNSAVQSYADGSFTRQLIIEDVGPA